VREELRLPAPPAGSQLVRLWRALRTLRVTPAVRGLVLPETG
jgi:hypothetical protein